MVPQLGLQVQDIVTRYASTTGHHCPRRFGCAGACAAVVLLSWLRRLLDTRWARRWDCHGLPVEYEIDKKLSESTHQRIYRCYHAKPLSAL